MLPSPRGQGDGTSPGQEYSLVQRSVETHSVGIVSSMSEVFGHELGRPLLEVRNTGQQAQVQAAEE
eukprot:9723957-Prorocentrum_lima.AAC.1